jgi:O-acetyl-ADP-ribose deacetylase (regulator of RNase III)
VNTLLVEITLPSGALLQLVQGDITVEASDAIVNAANEALRHGGGVAGAISRHGGPAIQAESDNWVHRHGPVSHTAPAWTSGGLLPCRYVIHAVGPRWSSGSGHAEDVALADAVTGSLRLADELQVASISFPSIATGIFGFPEPRAAGIILSTIPLYFESVPSSTIRVVRLVLYEDSTVAIYRKVWHDHFGA